MIGKPNVRGGTTFYWQPPSKLAKVENRPEWLCSTPLKDDAGRPLNWIDAARRAEALNARLDTWRKARGAVTGAMGAMIDKYLGSDAFAKLSPRTRKDYEGHIAAIKASMGDLSPADITRAVVHQYREHMAKAEGLHERALRYRLQVLRLLFSYGIDIGSHPGPNPAAKLRLKTPPARQSIWTMEQIRELAARPSPVGLAVKLAVYTTQREGDLLALRWDQYDGAVLTLTQGKTGRQLRLPLHAALRAALDAAPRLGPTILCRRDGHAYTGDGFRSIWHRAVDGFPKPRPTFHDVRRTATTWLAAGGLSDAELKLWTGHRRRGEDHMIDVYTVEAPGMRERAWPIMDAWGV